MNWPQMKVVRGLKLFGLFVPFMLLAGIACTTGEAELLQGFLQSADAVNGEITIVTKDGKTVTLTIATEAPVETEEASSAIETLEPGVSVVAEVNGGGQVVRRIVARQAKMEGRIVEVGDVEVTVESDRGRRATVLVTDRTRIKLEDDFSGALADLRVGAEVEIKFDPESRVAFKIDAGKEEAEIEGVVVGVDGNEIVIETERGRRLTLTINDRTRIELDEDFPGTPADIREGQEVEVKFDPYRRVAFKIDVEEKEAEIEGVVVGVDADEITIESEGGRRLTLTINDRTRIELDEDFPGTPADIRVGQEVEVKFDPGTGTALTVELEDGHEIRRHGSDNPTPSVDPMPTSQATATSPGEATEESSDTHEVDTPGARPANFRLLVSGDRNAIGDFVHLWVTIDRIRIQPVGGADGWLKIEVLDELRKLDLVELTGDTAVEIIRAHVPPGRYSKVIIHADGVEGELHSDVTIPVKLPSSKLQIVKPFEVQTGSVTTFVFDITVVAAGNEKHGIKYLLSPVIAQNGPARPFKEASLKPEPRHDLSLRLEGDIRPGSAPTLVVTDPDGNAVEGGVVTVNGELAGTTDVHGRLSVRVPEGEDELEVKVETGESEGELEVDLEEGSSR